mmetsp:Transcript_30398/g.69987  ORF Transcript_30398/g.69987 Transcript_30398/m.69987 type:complete len:281 (-) Transcript_30398:14-856(-)
MEAAIHHSERSESLSQIESGDDQGSFEARPTVHIRVGQDILLNTGAEDAWVEARVEGQTPEGAWKVEYDFRGRPRIMTIFPSRLHEMIRCTPQEETPSSPSSSLRATAGAVELPFPEFPSPPRVPRERAAPCQGDRAPPAKKVSPDRAPQAKKVTKVTPAQFTTRCTGLSKEMSVLASKMDSFVLQDHAALSTLAEELSSFLTDEIACSPSIGNFQAAIARHKLSSIESALQSASQTLRSESDLAASRSRRIAECRARSNSRGGLPRLEPSRSRPLLMSR